MSLSTLLPEGALPKWVLFTGLLSLSSTLQTYLQGSNPRLARTLYHRAPTTEVTPLASRLFGTWNLASTVIRAYAAYYPHERGTYMLAMWSYGIALAHFGVELMKGTVGGPVLIAAEITPVVSLAWMGMQWGKYSR